MRKNLKSLCTKMLSVTMAATMVLPGTIFCNVRVEAQNNPVNAVEEVATDDNHPDEEEQVIKGDYFRQYMTVLLKDELIKTDGKDVTFTEEAKGKGVLVSGKQSDIVGNDIILDKTFHFDGGVVERLSLDAITERGTNLTLGVYLDGNEQPVATFKLNRQKKKNDWTYSKDISVDLSELKLIGDHTVALKVIDASADKINFLIRSIEFVESSVPVVYFNIDEEYGTIAEMNTSEDHSAECYGTMTIKVPEGYVSEYTGKEVSGGTYELEYIRGRGNSTWMVDKKPYKIKLDKKADLLGMGKNKHWVLLANYYDNSLLRNKITYWLGEQLNMAYTPASEPVDVVMNGEYYGSYFLAEQIRVGENRVDIDDLEDSEETMTSTDPDIISGGYLLSLSPYGDETKKRFTTEHNVEFLIESPAFEDYSNETQYNYIKNYVQQLENAVYGKDFKDAQGVSYTEWMDVISTAYYYWMQEFSMNGDGFISTSTYLYKPRNNKLYFGPLWDFDYVAWGSTEYDGNYIKGWTQNTNMWFERLFEDKTFAKAVIDAWPVIKEKMEALIAPGGQLDIYKSKVEKSAAYNFEKWGMSDLGQYNMEEEESKTEKKVLTYDEEIERLRGWIKERMDWVNQNLNSIAPQECTVKFVADGKILKTATEYIGKTISSFPRVPQKKGYVFAGWTTAYHMDFEEYLKYIDCTEEELAEFMEKDEIADLKKNGFSYEGPFTGMDVLVKSATLTADYIPEDEYIKERKLVLNRTSIKLSAYSESVTLRATVIPFNATNCEIEWTSSDSSVASVENGEVMPMKSGDTVITATTANGLKATCQVHVCNDQELENVSFADTYAFPQESYTINLDEYKDLGLKYLPEDGIYSEDCRFFVGDDSILEVSEGGVVHGISVGTTTVYALGTYGEPVKCQVTVVDTAEVKTGEKYTIKGIKYRVTNAGETNGTVICVGTENKKAKSVKIPATVKIKNKIFKVDKIKTKAFYKMNRLMRVSIGDNVSFIGKSAFAKCKKLTSVSVGKKVQIIYQNAFAGDKKLAKILLKAKRIKINKGAFKGISKKAVFKVPKGSSKYYKLVLGKNLGKKKIKG